MIKIFTKKNVVDALILFIEKTEELKTSQFFDFYFNKTQKIHLKHKVRKFENGGIGSTSLTEPSEEVIKAYILPFRFLIQDNEICSLRNLSKKIIPDLNHEFKNEVDEFDNVRNDLNKFLDSPPPIKLNYTKGTKSSDFSTNRKIFETFIYGHYAHANIQNDKKEWYDTIHSHPDEGLNIISRNHFRYNALNTILVITNFLMILSNIIKKILNKIIENNLSRARDFLKKSNLESAEKAYLNSLYISNKIKNKEYRAKLCKEISEFFLKINKDEKAHFYTHKMEDIKDSIRYLSPDFWSDEYYRRKFALSKKFKKPLSKIIKVNLRKNPIIVLPIERFNQIKKFEKIVVAKNFRLTENTDKYSLYYEFLMSKQGDQSIWSHHTFELNKNEGYLLSFPFLDESGILFITNSPKLLVEWYCSWIELKRLHKELSIYFVLLQAYVNILIDIELDKGNHKRLHEDVKKMRKSKSATLSIEGNDKVNIHFQGLNRIISVLINILIYPKLKNIFDINEKIQAIKKHNIQPFLNTNFKGLAWLSFNLTIILYTIISKDNKIFDLKKNSQLEKLISICHFIEGKQFSEIFFEKFFDFLDLYINTLKIAE